MPEDRVEDEEVLYRRVRHEYLVFIEGEWKCGENAFGDPDQQPSVDRAKLQGDSPHPTRAEPSDGIARLVATKVRAIQTVVKRRPSGVQEYPYRIDIKPDPTEQAHRGFNPAHARIYATPEEKMGSKAWRMLKDELSAM